VTGSGAAVVLPGVSEPGVSTVTAAAISVTASGATVVLPNVSPCRVQVWSPRP
jgi:hypothetical protein